MHGSFVTGRTQERRVCAECYTNNNHKNYNVNIAACTKQ